MLVLLSRRLLRLYIRPGTACTSWPAPALRLGVLVDCVVAYLPNSFDARSTTRKMCVSVCASVCVCVCGCVSVFVFASVSLLVLVSMRLFWSVGRSAKKDQRPPPVRPA